MSSAFFIYPATEEQRLQRYILELLVKKYPYPQGRPVIEGTLSRSQINHALEIPDPKQADIVRQALNDLQILYQEQHDIPQLPDT